MNTINDYKLLAHIDRIASHDFKPITADIFLTNYCNNRCPYCTYKRWDLPNSDKHSITIDEFMSYYRVLSSIGVKGYILSGGGEPTICTDFDKITAFLESEHAHYGINTNFNIYREFRPDYLKVSLDSFDEDSYFIKRGVRKYHDVLENIERYVEWKRSNSPDTSVGIQCVVSSETDVYNFYEANYHLPVDYIIFRPVESTQGEFYQGEDPSDIIAAIDRYRMDDNRVIMNFKWNYIDQKFDTCCASWSQIALDERGNVMFCCHKPYEVIGHILDNDILEKKKSYNTNMSKCDIPCRLSGPNNLMNIISNHMSNDCFI